jgi:hypothetical protein
VTALRNPAAAAEVDAPRPSGPRPLLLEAFLAANTPPAGIDLGTAVLTCVAAGRARAGMKEEGVVIEVAPAGQWVRSDRVIIRRNCLASRSSATRYVVQCRDCRVLRFGAELQVISH